jgi:hypothetical protein
VVTLHVSGDRADYAPQSPGQRCGATLGDGHRQAELAADGGDLGPNEPGPDDEHPAGRGDQPLPQADGIAAGRQDEHAVQCGFGWIRPGPCPYAGGDQQAVKTDLAVGETDLLASQVQPGRGHAEPPVCIEVTGPGQRGALRRHPAVKDLLGERWPIVRRVGLVPDQGQGAGEALLAQLCCCPQARERRADDHDAAGAPEAVVAGAGGLGRGHGLAYVYPFNPQGLHRARSRRPLHLPAPRVIGLGVVPQGLIPVHPEYIRCGEGTLRVALAASEVNDESQEASPGIRSAAAAPTQLGPSPMGQRQPLRGEFSRG